ncbi:MAG: topoisomerase [Acidimicrobiaceae bacterium]
MPPSLRFVDDTEPGIRRKGTKRFRYVEDGTGSALRDREMLARIAALAIPPAWTDVWICADPGGHIQATGRDARGRKQYRYHADFRAERERTKFDQLVEFGNALPDIRRQVDEDLDRKGMPFERVVALVVSLLEQTFVRVGNESYAIENGTFGLTTLRRKHVVVQDGTISLKFKGKGGRAHEVPCNDARLCRLMRRCQDLGGQLLFEYRDEEGDLSPVSSQDVNAYLRAASGLDATAKTFRTWGATVLAAAAFAVLDAPETVKERQLGVKTVVGAVADELGNTPTVCRASYIHPVVIERYEDGTLPARWAKGPSRDGHGLIAEERRLLHVLGSRRRRPSLLPAAA